MWKCPQCSEQHEDQFASCWKCNAAQPGERDHGASCSCCDCGVSLGSDNWSWCMPAPDYYWSVPEDERADRTVLTADQCIVDDEHFFIAGILEIPVIGGGAPVSYTCWSSLSLKSHELVCDSWEDPNRVNLPPMFGWFSNQLPGYAETENLKIMVHLRAPGLKPMFELEPTEHPLSVDYHLGVARERAVELRKQTDRR